MGQFEQVVSGRGGGSEEVGYVRSISLLPRAPMQNLAGQMRHIASVIVTQVQNERRACAQMPADGCQRLLLPHACNNMPEGAKRDHRQAILLRKLKLAH